MMCGMILELLILKCSKKDKRNQIFISSQLNMFFFLQFFLFRVRDLFGLLLNIKERTEVNLAQAQPLYDA